MLALLLVCCLSLMMNAMYLLLLLDGTDLLSLVCFRSVQQTADRFSTRNENRDDDDNNAIFSHFHLPQSPFRYENFQKFSRLQAMEDTGLPTTAVTAADDSLKELRRVKTALATSEGRVNSLLNQLELCEVSHRTTLEGTEHALNDVIVEREERDETIRRLTMELRVSEAAHAVVKRELGEAVSARDLEVLRADAFCAEVTSLKGDVMMLEESNRSLQQRLETHPRVSATMDAFAATTQVNAPAFELKANVAMMPTVERDRIGELSDELLLHQDRVALLEGQLAVYRARAGSMDDTNSDSTVSVGTCSRYACMILDQKVNMLDRLQNASERTVQSSQVALKHVLQSNALLEDKIQELQALAKNLDVTRVKPEETFRAALMREKKTENPRRTDPFALRSAAAPSSNVAPSGRMSIASQAQRVKDVSFDVEIYRAGEPLIVDDKLILAHVRHERLEAMLDLEAAAMSGRYVVTSRQTPKLIAKGFPSLAGAHPKEVINYVEKVNKFAQNHAMGRSTFDIAFTAAQAIAAKFSLEEKRVPNFADELGTHASPLPWDLYRACLMHEYWSETTVVLVYRDFLDIMQQEHETYGQFHQRLQLAYAALLALSPSTVLIPLLSPAQFNTYAFTRMSDTQFERLNHEHRGEKGLDSLTAAHVIEMNRSMDGSTFITRRNLPKKKPSPAPVGGGRGGSDAKNKDKSKDKHKQDYSRMTRQQLNLQRDSKGGLMYQALRLLQEGYCIRCGQSGHRGTSCPKYGNHADVPKCEYDKCSSNFTHHTTMCGYHQY